MDHIVGVSHIDLVSERRWHQVTFWAMPTLLYDMNVPTYINIDFSGFKISTRSQVDKSLFIILTAPSYHLPAWCMQLCCHSDGQYGDQTDQERSVFIYLPVGHLIANGSRPTYTSSFV